MNRKHKSSSPSSSSTIAIAASKDQVNPESFGGGGDITNPSEKRKIGASLTLPGAGRKKVEILENILIKPSSEIPPKPTGLASASGKANDDDAHWFPPPDYSNEIEDVVQPQLEEIDQSSSSSATTTAPNAGKYFFFI